MKEVMLHDQFSKQDSVSVTSGAKQHEGQHLRLSNIKRAQSWLCGHYY